MVNSQERRSRQGRNDSVAHRNQTTPRSRAGVGSAVRDTKGRIALTLPLLGKVLLPPAEQTAYYAGIGALVALEVVEWPVALALAVGHALITQQQNPTLHELAQALEDVERG